MAVTTNIGIPAITLYNPWAAWVIDQLKPIETRTHNRFRSLVGKTIAIHAGLHLDTLAWSLAREYLPKDRAESLACSSYPAGVVLGLAKVKDFGQLGPEHSRLAMIDCSRQTRWGLFFGRVEKFAEPIPAKGGRGRWYWTPPDDRYIRDVDHPCGQFVRGDNAGDCQSDGHYMCKECVHLDPGLEEEAA